MSQESRCGPKMSPPLTPIKESHQWEYSPTHQQAWRECGCPSSSVAVEFVARKLSPQTIAAGKYAGTEVALHPVMDASVDDIEGVNS